MPSVPGQAADDRNKRPTRAASQEPSGYLRRDVISSVTTRASRVGG
jgi:hypothetical protein